MKILGILLWLLVSVHAQARDYGDFSCNVVLIEAENHITGCCGNYYQGSVAVSKTILSQHFRSPQVRLQYNGSVVAEPVDVKESGRYMIYFFKLPFGATYHTQSLSVIPYVANGMDRLFDNNFGQGEVVLEKWNNWRFKQNHCKLN